MNGGAIASTSTSRAAIKKALLAIQLTRQHQEQTASLPAVKTTRRLWQAGAAGAVGVDLSALGAGTQGGVLKGRTVSDQSRKRERLNRARSKGEVTGVYWCCGS